MENLKKKSQVVMLPTEKACGLGGIYKCINNPLSFSDEIVGNLCLNVNPRIIKSNDFFEAQHLYITSDDEIKDEDWYIDDIGIIRQAIVVDRRYWRRHPEFKKIIASTDKSLGLPEPSPEFIEAYIKAYNSRDKIEEVMVEYIKDKKYSMLGKEPETIIFPKTNKSNHISISRIKTNFTRADIIHAFTYGYHQAKLGVPHGTALSNYKAENNL